MTQRSNPVTDVERFEERAVERFLTPAERQALERVLEQAERTTWGQIGYIRPDAIAAIRLLALTGARPDRLDECRMERVTRAGRSRTRRSTPARTSRRGSAPVHESLSLSRFSSRLVQTMLPFRIRRVG